MHFKLTIVYNFDKNRLLIFIGNFETIITLDPKAHNLGNNFGHHLNLFRTLNSVNQAPRLRQTKEGINESVQHIPSIHLRRKIS